MKSDLIRGKYRLHLRSFLLLLLLSLGLVLNVRGQITDGDGTTIIDIKTAMGEKETETEKLVEAANNSTGNPTLDSGERNVTGTTTNENESTPSDEKNPEEASAAPKTATPPEGVPSPGEEIAPSAAPVPETKKDTMRPTLQPVEADQDTTVPPPTPRPTTKAPIQPPVTDAPVSKPPTESPTTAPTKPIIKPPTTAPTRVKEEEKCDIDGDGSAIKSCDACKYRAKSLGSTTYTCWWDETEQKCGKSGLYDHIGEEMCKKSEEMNGDETIDNAASIGTIPLVIGLIVVTGVIIFVVKKVNASATLPLAAGSADKGKYQGVSTLADEGDDEEWGWDDEPKKSVEMPSMRTTRKDTLHRRSHSPRFRGSDDSNSSSKEKSAASASSSTSTPQAGLSVKRHGMKNPLHSSQPQPPPARAIPKPSPDDFFAEMGVSSAPKKLPTTSATQTTSSLGATKLPVDDAEVDATWADDADLDDLLDD